MPCEECSVDIFRSEAIAIAGSGDGPSVGLSVGLSAGLSVGLLVGPLVGPLVEIARNFKS